VLIRNETSLGSNPCRHLGMNSVYVTGLPNWTHTGARRNIFSGYAGVFPSSGIPNGTEPPVSWLIPKKGGGLASYNGLYGEGELDLDSLSMGVALAGNLSGSGTISTAVLTLIASLIASLTASGTISSATLTAQANLSAALDGSGDISTAVLVLLYQMEADLTGSGTISAALLQTIASLAADLDGSGGINAAALALTVTLAATIAGSGAISTATLQSIMRLASILSGNGTVSSASLALIVYMVAQLAGTGGSTGNLKGFLSMAADINVTGSEITTANIGSSVWNALAVLSNETGSMGELLNNAGAGGNPWDTVIESGYTAEEVLRILLAVSAGKTTVTSLGGGAATVTFRDQGDTKDRVSVDMQDSNRIAVTIDEA